MTKRLITAALAGCLMAPVATTSLQAQTLVQAVGVQIAGCEAGTKIDGTTAAETKKKIEAAGYTQVHDLAKACDNVWHAVATNKDGATGNVMVTPQGEVMPEGN